MSLSVGTSSLPVDSFSDPYDPAYRCRPPNSTTGLHRSHANEHQPILPGSRGAFNGAPDMAPPPHMRPPPSVFGETFLPDQGFPGPPFGADTMAPPIGEWGSARGAVVIRSGDDDDQSRHVPITYRPPPHPPRPCGSQAPPAPALHLAEGVTIRKGNDDDFDASQAFPLSASSFRISPPQLPLHIFRFSPHFLLPSPFSLSLPQAPPHLRRLDPAFPVTEYPPTAAAAPSFYGYGGRGDFGAYNSSPQRFDGAGRVSPPQYGGVGAGRTGGSPQMYAAGGRDSGVEWPGHQFGSDPGRGRRSLDGGTARMGMGAMGVRDANAAGELREMAGVGGMRPGQGVFTSRSYDEQKNREMYGERPGAMRGAVCADGIGTEGSWRSGGEYYPGEREAEGRSGGGSHQSALSLKEELAALDLGSDGAHDEAPLRSSQQPNSDESWNLPFNPSCEYPQSNQFNNHPKHSANVTADSGAYLSADFSIYSSTSLSLPFRSRYPTSGFPPGSSGVWGGSVVAESDAGSVMGGGGAGAGGDCRLFTQEQLARATDNWNPANQLGKGAFGTVYRGRVMGCEVAVKRLEGSSWQGPDEYMTEVEVLSRMRHPHIVLLMGHCPDAMCLVYEYLPGGSLQDHLKPTAGRRPLSVVERVRVASEVASALLFLHHHDPPIAHRDLKPDNVLLDANRGCKLADVGLARLIAEDDATTTRVRGTVGYIDPEEVLTFEISVLSDVYALGLIMLQLLTGDAGIKSLHRRIKPFQDALDRYWEQGGAVGSSSSSSSGSPMVQAVAALVSEHLDVSGGEWPLSVACQLAEWGLRCAARQRACRPDLAGELQPALHGLVEEMEAGERQRQQSIEDQFVCPLSHMRMTDPVVAADGFTYERRSIEEWLKTHDTSPSTHEPLPHKYLTPNHSLRMLLHRFRSFFFFSFYFLVADMPASGLLASRASSVLADLTAMMQIHDAPAAAAALNLHPNSAALFPRGFGVGIGERGVSSSSRCGCHQQLNCRARRHARLLAARTRKAVIARAAIRSASPPPSIPSSSTGRTHAAIAAGATATVEAQSAASAILPTVAIPTILPRGIEQEKVEGNSAILNDMLAGGSGKSAAGLAESAARGEGKTASQEVVASVAGERAEGAGRTALTATATAMVSPMRRKRTTGPVVLHAADGERREGGGEEREDGVRAAGMG
ncbi:unnamed protein product [Closterium sp. NIES-54]